MVPNEITINVILHVSARIVCSHSFMSDSMERYTLQKRMILSFETKQDEDGDVDYTYIVDAYFLLFYVHIVRPTEINLWLLLHCLLVVFVS